MMVQQPETVNRDEPTFTWHPEYRGRTSENVERELADQISNDQRAYELALSGAEKSEHQALASVMELEKRWSIYSFDWPETSADELARRIVDFEMERNRRQEMISYEQYCEEAEPARQAAGGGWRESMSDAERRRIANIGAAAILLLIVVVIIVVVGIVL